VSVIRFVFELLLYPLLKLVVAHHLLGRLLLDNWLDFGFVGERGEQRRLRLELLHLHGELRVVLLYPGFLLEQPPVLKEGRVLERGRLLLRQRRRVCLRIIKWSLGVLQAHGLVALMLEF